MVLPGLAEFVAPHTAWEVARQSGVREPIQLLGSRDTNSLELLAFQ